MPELRPSDDGLERAREILERQRRRVAGVVDGELILTGASSLPGALTGGDVDLQLRVDASAASVGAPPFVLAELDYLLATRIGQVAERALLAEVARGVGPCKVIAATGYAVADGSDNR